MTDPNTNYSPIPPDNPDRKLSLAQLEDTSLPHIGLAGDTYTVTVSGAETDGRFCVIDMLIPPGGGPAPHRHDYEETFILLEGEIEFTFRGQKTTAHGGTSVTIPANAPHYFRNLSSSTAHIICICAPAGIERFFAAVGVPLPTRRTIPPPLDETQAIEFQKKSVALAPQYLTEILRES